MENTYVENVTEMEQRWFTAVDRANSGNPLMALLGPRGAVEVLAFRARLREGQLALTCDHAASSYGVPVIVDAHGNAYGPGEWISMAARIDAPKFGDIELDDRRAQAVGEAI